MITEVGALVGILKALLEAAKSGRELLGGGASKKATAEAVRKTQDRLAGIADQLFQSVALSKMLPIWLKEHATVDLYTDALSDDEVKLLDSRLRQLISDSIHDHFSGTFFRTSFAVLPGVEAGIKGFRDRLLALETQLNGIPPGDATSWRRAWPIVKVRMHDLRLEAVKLDNLADDVHASLVRELKDAAQLA
jgi:gas vesicle protein